MYKTHSSTLATSTKSISLAFLHFFIPSFHCPKILRIFLTWKYCVLYTYEWLFQNDTDDVPSSSVKRKAGQPDEKNFERLYENALVENAKLAETLASLKKQIVKKDRQIDLLINALKRSLSKDGGDDLASVIDTVSDGDYQIVVI